MSNAHMHMATNPDNAADGAPKSDIIITGQRINGLFKVKDKETGATAMVNEAIFKANRGRYERVTETGTPVPTRKRLVVPVYTNETEVELGAMTMTALKKMPEFEAIPEPKPSKKSEIVAAILKVRTGV